MLQVHREMQQLEQDQQEQKQQGPTQQEFLKRKGGRPLRRLHWLASEGLRLSSNIKAETLTREPHYQHFWQDTHRPEPASVNQSRCPSVRGCPRCGIFINHKDGYKHMIHYGMSQPDTRPSPRCKKRVKAARKKLKEVAMTFLVHG